MEERLHEPPGNRPAGRGVEIFFEDEEVQPAQDEPLTSSDLGLDPPTPPVQDDPEAAQQVKTVADQGNDSHAEDGDDIAASVAAAYAVEASFDESYEGAGEADLPEAAVLGELAEAVDEQAEVAVPEVVAATAAAASVARVEDLPRVDQPPPPAAAAAGAPPPLKAAQGSSRTGGCLRSLGLVLLATLLGAALALALLFVVNGTLRWSAQQEVVALKNNVAALQRSSQALEAQVATMQGGLTGARSDLGNLQDGLATLGDNLGSLQEGFAKLGGDVEGLQGTVAVLPKLQEDLTAAQAQVAALEAAAAALTTAMDTVQENLGALTEQVDEVAASAERSDSFLTALRDVLNNIYGEAPTTTVVTPTGVLTPTVPLTVTQTITPAAVLTPTLPITTTPTLTATLPITATPVVTATVAVTATPGVTATVPPLEAATPTPAAAQPSIRGVVFIDANRNGRLDPGEMGLAGVRVALRRPNQTDLQVVTTDLRGAYAFYDLPPGRYMVIQTDASGYGSTTPNAMMVIVRGATPATVDFGDYRLGQ